MGSTPLPGRRWGILFLAIVASFSSDALGGNPIDRELRALLLSKPHAKARAAACVIDLTTGATVHAHHADDPMTPASVMKLFTMAAALETLGVDFSFVTRLTTDGRDLTVTGDGDPAFGDAKLQKERHESLTADFDRWAKALGKADLTTIPGDLVLDESIFDDVWTHPTWDERDLGRWYSAPIGALNFNDNCVDITVTPGPQPESPALISVSPPTNLIEIVNRCRSGGVRDPILYHPPGTFRYIITGRCGKRWPFPPVAFPDPGLLFGDTLRSVLTDHGIVIQGETRRIHTRDGHDRVRPPVRRVAKHTTPLGDVLRRIGKNSQNLFAECLLKRTGYALAVRRHDPAPKGTWANGTQAVRHVLKEANINPSGFEVADGSGLSRENACSARQLVQLLAWMRRRPGHKLLLDSLSVGGIDGSLRQHFEDAPGRVFAKTGTMKGVRTLAGYVSNDAGPRYAFAVMFNGYTGPSTPYKAIQDRFCRVLIREADRSSKTHRANSP